MDGRYHAVYAQDSWRLSNFTINYGVRSSRLSQSIIGQDAQIGRFANSPGPTTTSRSRRGATSRRACRWCDIFGNGQNRQSAARREPLPDCSDHRYLRRSTTPRRDHGDLTWTDPTATTSRRASAAACSAPSAARSTSRSCRQLRHSRARRPIRTSKRPVQLVYNLGVTARTGGTVWLTAEWCHNRFTYITERNNLARNSMTTRAFTGGQPNQRRHHHAYNVIPEACLRSRTSTPRLRHLARLQRLRAGLQRAVAARRPRVRRLQSRTDHLATAVLRSPTRLPGVPRPERRTACPGPGNSSSPALFRCRRWGVTVSAIRPQSLNRPRRRHRGNPLRRVHLRHRLRHAAWSGHLLEHHPDHPLRRQLPVAVPSR